MSKRRVKKSNKQSRAGLAFVAVIVAVIILASGIRTASLHQKSKELTITESQLENQLEEENNRAVELEEREKYMKTKKYIEDEAKNKLGLVNSDEILIKPREDDN